MGLKNEQVKFVKVPRRTRISSNPQVFPRMPRMYLELIENKDKIKQDLINKEYVPSVTIKEEKYDSDTLSIESDSPLRNQNKNQNFDSSDSDKLSDSEIYDSSDNESIVSISTDNSEELSKRLNELLNEESDDNDYKYKQKIKKTPTNAPTLSEIKQQGGYIPPQELRNVDQVNLNEQEDENLKREFLFKFDLLRKSYPTSLIPEYTIHTDLNTIKENYEHTVRRLSLDSSVENYKTYLVYGFMGCEFVFGNFLGFDMQGFTQQQIISMNNYEKLLIELGEKSYVPTGSRWSVELRLFFMIIMNAAFFIVSKMLMKKTGANLMSMINSMNKTNQPVKKRKMKGPDINLDDIP